MSVTVTFVYRLHLNIIYRVFVSDVYVRGLSGSWRDRVFAVRLSVCGHVQSLSRVRAALTEHPLRMLSIRKECVTPPPQPPSPVAQPPSPTSSSLSTVSSVSPFQQHQPSWLLLSSSPLSNPATSTPQRKHRADTSPPPSSQDSDETRLPTSLSHIDSDETMLGPSPE